MKRNILYKIVFLFLGCLVLFSCKKEEPVTITKPGTPQLKDRVIETKVVLNNVWTEYTSSKKDASDPIFMCYLFDPNGSFLQHEGGYMNASSDMKVIFDKATGAGVHSIYGVTGWLTVDEYPRSSTTQINLNTPLPLVPDRNISLGCTTFTIVDSTMNYSVQVTTDYIMAILDLDIKYVPSYIESITVQLPNQGNTFKFDGTINGSTQAETLQLTKSTTPNENGSYDWSIDGAIVLPSATGTQTMPIDVIYTKESGITDTISTSTTICCASGTHKSLWAEWDAFYAATTVVVNPWTTEIETGEFDL